MTSSGVKPPHRILVVDDNHDVRQLCATALIRSGYVVDTAEDGAAGWEALCTNGYSLLVTDHSMPNLSGMELVEKLRSARMELPVVLVSGAIPTELSSRRPSLRLAATLVKPFSPTDLVDTVEKALKNLGSACPPGITFPSPSSSASDHTQAPHWRSLNP